MSTVAIPSLPVRPIAVWSQEHRLHRPGGEIWVGVRIPGTELPERGDAVRTALLAEGYEVRPPEAHPDTDLTRIHDPRFIEFLSTVWDEWKASGYMQEPGMDRVVPYVFALPQVTSRRPPNPPASVGARAGLYAMDTMTLIGPGTWEAARAAAWCALTAADLVAAGRHAAYAAVRPPGHHAGRSMYGGACYLNNAALAAQRLLDRGAGSVGIVDVDAHHGNGTQEIFFARGEVLYGSVHVDPAEGWFPHYLGAAHERGDGPGTGANLNLPLPPGAGDESWLAAIERLIEFVDGVDALVVSLGVDAAADDQESPLTVSGGGFETAGHALAGLGLPTVVVQEGGYHLPTLGLLVTLFLAGFDR